MAHASDKVLLLQHVDACPDGLLIMHNGEVKYQYLLEGIPQWQTHALNSASKVFTGCVAAILAEQGLLDWQKPLDTYVDELKGTGTGHPVLGQASHCIVHA